MRGFYLDDITKIFHLFLMKRGYSNGDSYVNHSDRDLNEPIVTHDSKVIIPEEIRDFDIRIFNETPESKDYFIQGFKAYVLESCYKNLINDFVGMDYTNPLNDERINLSELLELIKEKYKDEYNKYKLLQTWYDSPFFKTGYDVYYYEKYGKRFVSEGYREIIFNMMFHEPIKQALSKFVTIEESEYQKRSGFIPVPSFEDLLSQYNIEISWGYSDSSLVTVFYINNNEALDLFFSGKGGFYSIRYIEINDNEFREIVPMPEYINEIFEEIRSYVEKKLNIIYLDWYEINVNITIPQSIYYIPKNLRAWLFDGSNGEDRYFSLVEPLNYGRNIIKENPEG